MATERAGALGLRREAIGLREVLFQSITEMAPAAAIAASIPTGASFAGGSLPLSVVFALIGCLFCASCVAELARELPAAGSMATYTARGLHPSIGFLVAWGYAIVGALVPPLVLLQLGFTVASTVHAQFPGYPAGLWWPWTVLGALIVLAAGYYGVQASARLGTVLGLFEILVFLVLGAFFVVHAGAANTLSVFTPAHTPKAHRGMGGIIAGSIYTILAFAGFEAAAPLAEEARDPRRTVRRAVLLATLLIGLLYIFTTYAAAVAYGPGRFAHFGVSGGASWVGMARAFYGLFWFFAFLAIVNSTIANSNAGVNVSSRTVYAMGRVRAFPAAFATVHPRYRSPVVGIVLTVAFTLAVGLGLGAAYGPDTAFAMVGTALVIIIVGIYILVDAACIGYFVRVRGRRLNPVLHLLFPVLGIAAFVPAWLTAVGAPAFAFISPLTPPLSYMGLAVGAYMILGLAYLVVLRRRHPDRVVDVGLVHADSEAPEPGAVGVTAGAGGGGRTGV